MNWREMIVTARPRRRHCASSISPIILQGGEFLRPASAQGSCEQMGGSIEDCCATGRRGCIT